MNESSLDRFLDEQGRILVWPARKHTSRRILMLEYLVEAFEFDREYSEAEVNELLRSRHAFDDPAYLRRTLIDSGRLERDSYGRSYRRTR